MIDLDRKRADARAQGFCWDCAQGWPCDEHETRGRQPWLVPLQERVRVSLLAEVRRKLEYHALYLRCNEPDDPPCRGWNVYESDRGFEIEACGDCWHGVNDEHRLDDADMELLPEAQAELAKTLADNPEGAP